MKWLIIGMLLAACKPDGGMPTWKEHPPKWKYFDGGSFPPGDDVMEDW